MNRTAWGRRNYYCFLCGITDSLETHEILRGIFRAKAVKEASCWLRLCHHCHQQTIHGNPEYWNRTRQLALKALHDPENYDRQRLNELGSLREIDKDRITEREVMVALRDLLMRFEVYTPQ